jgi:hypothetical protein
MPMKGARAAASGVLVLAAVCAVPAISAAQDPGTTTTDVATITTTEPVNAAPADASSDTPPAETSAGDLSPITESAVRDSSRGSVGVPAAAPSDDAPAGVHDCPGSRSPQRNPLPPISSYVSES